MGKKTLEEVGKILLVSFISILISVMATRRVLIDKKLDKDEYISDQKQKWDGHKVVHDKDDDKIEKMYDMIEFLYQRELNSK